MEIAVIIQQILFVGACAGIGFLLFRRIGRIRSNILLGKPAAGPTDRKDERLRNMLLIAFGQKKMFDRPLVGMLHFMVYAGFLVINIEVAEIVLDGIFGTHRLFAPLLGGAYGLLLNIFEGLALCVLLACAVFLVRRNVLKIKRFWSAEMIEWPRNDANNILVFEILLMSALFTMNAADSVLQSRAGESSFIAAHYPLVGEFLVSSNLLPLLQNFGTETLIALERGMWWFHILGIFGFALYVTYSKHLHIALAFPNTYFASLEPAGKMRNMPEVTKEVKAMMSGEEPPAEEGEIGRFGVKEVTDLSRNQLMQAYSCTECGRCTSVCPANLTGKKLSPRKIMMDSRDRLEEIGENLAKNGADFDDGKSLYGDYISKEELMACTSCNACVDACPVNINPLGIILEMRRYVAMEESATPASWNSMFANIENNFAPWAFSPSDRFNWAEELKAENES